MECVLAYVADLGSFLHGFSYLFLTEWGLKKVTTAIIH
uniref:Uncharacterized protein n=1 Tax=Anguilla anguilla TaxID=7936 RepID=A0A0E9RM39_ANGAN